MAEYFALVAFDEDRASAVTTLDALAGVDDDHVRVVGDDILIPEPANIIGVYAFHGSVSEGNPTGAQLTSPGLKGLISPDIPVMHSGAEVLTPDMIQMFLENPIPVVKDDPLNALMTNGAITAARGVVGIWLAMAPLAPVTGDIRTVKCTTVITGVADKWSSCALAFSQDLPVGTYQVVGARCIEAATFGLFRFIFTGGRWRPGGVIQNYVRYADLPIFRRGKMGVWGEFTSTTPPRVEFMAISAVSNPDLYLDLIKTG